MPGAMAAQPDDSTWAEPKRFAAFLKSVPTPPRDGFVISRSRSWRQFAERRRSNLQKGLADSSFLKWAANSRTAATLTWASRAESMSLAASRRGPEQRRESARLIAARNS